MRRTLLILVVSLALVAWYTQCDRTPQCADPSLGDDINIAACASAG